MSPNADTASAKRKNLFSTSIIIKIGIERFKIPVSNVRARNLQIRGSAAEIA